MFKTKLPATVFAFLLTSSVMLAQAPPCVSDDPYAVPIDTISTTLSVVAAAAPDTTDSVAVADSSGGDTSISYRTKGKSNGQIIFEIHIWRTNNGYVYSIPTNSIRFSGDGAVIDSMSTLMLFDLLAQASVGKGYTAGYSTCPSTCGSNLVRVVLPACVRRMGSGVNTRFESCKPGACCTRTYSLCCPDGSGAPRMQLVGSAGSDCSGGDGGGSCESLCR